jgi:P22 coat protein - gene protein 5
MTIATFIPEVWAAELLDAVQKSLVFGSPLVINTDYEGEIASAGDTVHINAIGDPTISTYTPGGTLTYEDLTTADQTLVVDQSKSFSFKVDDIDARQAAGDVMPKAMGRAGYKLRDVVDLYIEALFAGAQAANAVGTVAVAAATPTAAYDSVLIPLKVKLDEANVPTEGRFVVLPPWLHGRLLRDDRFVRADAAGGTIGGVQGNGYVGAAAGFNCLVSNNCANTTGDDYRVSAGVPDAITLATQIAQTEALRLQTTFADALRGLLLYGAKLVRPELVATAIASQT